MTDAPSPIRRCLLLAALSLSICACHRSPAMSANRAPLFQGMGAIHHPISNVSPEAQRYFDQGLALVYAFNFGEAINSFQQASRLDPNVSW